MFTHKIVKKEIVNNTLSFDFEFTDGVKTFVENIRPQDEVGLKHWLRSRLTSLNSLDGLETLNVGDSVVLDEVVPELTPEEIKKREYEEAKYKLVTLKQEVELGLKTQAEFDVEVNKVKTKEVIKKN